MSRQRPPLTRIADNVFCRQVLGIRRTPAIATEVQGSTIAQDGGVTARESRRLRAETLCVHRGLGQEVESAFDVASTHRPPSRNSLIRRIQLCRMRSGGTGVS